jgi:hypothetical protein
VGWELRLLDWADLEEVRLVSCYKEAVRVQERHE